MHQPHLKDEDLVDAYKRRDNAQEELKEAAADLRVLASRSGYGPTELASVLGISKTAARDLLCSTPAGSRPKRGGNRALRVVNGGEW